MAAIKFKKNSQSEKFKKKGPRFALELNSHGLSYAQQCEQLYKFNEVDWLCPIEEYYPFKRGEGITRYLAVWYEARKRNYDSKRLKKLEEFMFKRMARTRFFKNVLKDEDDGLHIATRLFDYFNKYRFENYPIIAVEKGFSKVIYENDNVLFTYSGRPDLVVDFGDNFGVGPIDHKSESRESNIATFNNQFLGYCWALGAKVGMVNYIGLQKDNKNGEVFRRVAFTFTDAQIEKWRQDTIQWYRRIMFSIVNKTYLRSWRCEGKYGICRYYKICCSGSKAEELIKIKRDFKKLEEPYKSW